MMVKPAPRQRASKPTGPIMRAVMLDIALCLLGVALYLQTKMIALLVGCAVFGTVIVVAAVLQKRKAAASGQPQRRQGPRPPRASRSASESNVIEFKRPTGRKSGRSDDDDQKSNWPSA